MKQILLLILFFPFIGFSQVQIGSDIDGIGEGEHSGRAVSLNSDGTIVAIGAHWADYPNTNMQLGRVSVYEFINNNWIQRGQDLFGQTNFCYTPNFGYSVSLSGDGNILAIGDPFYCEGRVSIYEYISNTWVLLNYIEGGLRFGESLSLSNDGNKIAIGANEYNSNFEIFGAGLVRVFENINGGWTQIGDNISGHELGDLAGSSVSLSGDGNILAIGAHQRYSGSGYVFIYENINSVWTQVGNDILGDVNSNQYFGWKVSLSFNGNKVAISDPSYANNSGLVRIYENMNNAWTQLGYDIYGEASGDQCGYSLSLNTDGTIVAIGANKNHGESVFSERGHVRIFKYVSEDWIQVGNEILGENHKDFSGSSTSITSDGSIIAIGAPNNNPNYDPDDTTQSSTYIGHVRVYSIASELALLEVVDDILGNSNGINVTAEQLNSIDGVSGAIDGVNYTTALNNGIFEDENNPTAIEIQLIIDQVNNILSLNDNSFTNFLLYPNPSQYQVTIQLQEGLNLKEVNIYNTLGQFISTSKEKLINISHLSQGMYLIEIVTNQGKATKKLIVE